MKKEHIPLILIIISLVLIVVNVIASEKIDGEFWLQITSSVLIIIAMIFAIRDKKNRIKMIFNKILKIFPLTRFLLLI